MPEQRREECEAALQVLRVACQNAIQAIEQGWPDPASDLRSAMRVAERLQENPRFSTSGKPGRTLVALLRSGLGVFGATFICAGLIWQQYGIMIAGAIMLSTSVSLLTWKETIEKELSRPPVGN